MLFTIHLCFADLTFIFMPMSNVYVISVVDEGSKGGGKGAAKKGRRKHKKHKKRKKVFRIGWESLLGEDAAKSYVLCSESAPHADLQSSHCIIFAVHKPTRLHRFKLFLN